MALRGLKPTPTALKRLRGNPGGRPLNDAEPLPPPVDWAAPPPELRDVPDALAEWHRLVPALRQCKQITAADRSALLAMCFEWSRYLDAMRHVQATGAIIEAPRTRVAMVTPWLSVAMKALNNCQKLWPELGLTPSGRSRVRVASDGDDDDAFGEFDRPPRRASS